MTDKYKHAENVLRRWVFEYLRGLDQRCFLFRDILATNLRETDPTKHPNWLAEYTRLLSVLKSMVANGCIEEFPGQQYIIKCPCVKGADDDACIEICGGNGGGGDA